MTQFSPLSPLGRLVSLAYAGTDMPVHIVLQSDTGVLTLNSITPPSAVCSESGPTAVRPSSCWKPSGNAGPWIRQPDSAAGASSRCAASSVRA